MTDFGSGERRGGGEDDEEEEGLRGGDVEDDDNGSEKVAVIVLNSFFNAKSSARWIAKSLFSIPLAFKLRIKSPFTLIRDSKSKTEGGFMEEEEGEEDDEEEEENVDAENKLEEECVAWFRRNLQEVVEMEMTGTNAVALDEDSLRTREDGKGMMLIGSL